MIRSFTACSATIRAMCSIILSCSRMRAASEGAAGAAGPASASRCRV